MRYEPLRIEIAQETLDDLHDRLLRTRWPDEVLHADSDYGVPLRFMRDVVDYWATSFDWRATERRVNSFHNYRAEIGGMGVHFIHEPGQGPAPIPLLINHGWPSSFLEMLDIIPLLVDPGRFGGDPRDAFDVIVPSIPGYGFSDRPPRRGFSYPDVAEMWLGLMDGLGYERFAAHAHDHGAAIMTRINVGHPERVIGYHTTEPSIPGAGVDLQSEGLTDAERAFLEVRATWQMHDEATHGSNPRAPRQSRTRSTIRPRASPHGS